MTHTYSCRRAIRNRRIKKRCTSILRLGAKKRCVRQCGYTKKRKQVRLCPHRVSTQLNLIDRTRNIHLGVVRHNHIARFARTVLSPKTRLISGTARDYEHVTFTGIPRIPENSWILRILRILVVTHTCTYVHVHVCVRAA